MLVHYITRISCSPAFLRGTNLALTLAMPHLVASLLDKLRDRPRRDLWTTIESISISQLPVLYFFAFLYYTDVLSVFLVLLALRLALGRQHALSALVREGV